MAKGFQMKWLNWFGKPWVIVFILCGVMLADYYGVGETPPEPPKPCAEVADNHIAWESPPEGSSPVMLCVHGCLLECKDICEHYGKVKGEKHMDLDHLVPDSLWEEVPHDRT